LAEYNWQCKNECHCSHVMVVSIATARCFFRRALPDARLGHAHASLEDFRRHVPEDSFAQTKEYTLIVVTELATQRILLGKKHRGFGQGMYNSFGGKVEPGEAIDGSAIRELHEETGIEVMKNHLFHVGTLHFTFADSVTEMMVHLFRVQIQLVITPDRLVSMHPVVHVRPSDIRGCEEITPEWFDDWTQIPLDNMFADDSIWLPYLLLTTPSSLRFHGWFHFQAGGQETNTILHHCVQTYF
jgi:8-oxo-dGTP pyrophosphatase MutT (NUDIX family)